MTTPSRPPHPQADRARRQLAEHVGAWRRILGLTQEQAAQRAGISRSAYVRVESGEPGVTLDAVMRVLAVLRVVDGVVAAADPFTTDLGRARADHALRRRVTR